MYVTGIDHFHKWRRVCFALWFFLLIRSTGLTLAQIYFGILPIQHDSEGRKAHNYLKKRILISIAIMKEVAKWLRF